MSSGKGSRDRLRGQAGLALGAGLTAAMLGLAQPPVEWSGLAWAALVPLLLALRVRPGKAGLLILWLAGMAYGVTGFFYIRHVSWLGMAFLGFYISLYFLCFAALVRWLSGSRRIPLALAAPLAWTALEQVRGMLLTGLPWLSLAHTQYKSLPIVQIADIAGAAGVTFWVVAVNGVLADGVRCLRRWRPAARPAHVLTAAASVLLFSVGAQWYGRHRLDTIVTKRGPSIAVIQGNIPQDVKNILSARNVIDIFLKHVKLTETELAQDVATPPELVIWPETMAPSGTLDFQHNVPENEYLDRLAPLQRRSDLLISALSVTEADKELELRNSVFMLPRGRRGATERYDKIHLVPFGEYVPLKRLTGWIVAPLIPYKTGLAAGTQHRLFEWKGWRFAPTVCYEDGFPSLVADFARGPEKMDFIVNVTNEGWFKDGIELDQHLAIAVFRAIECRAGFVRAANTGISAFIAPTGRIVSKLEVDGRDREVSGVLHGFAMTSDVRSPYLAVGETFGWLNVAVLAVLCVTFALARARRGRGGESPRPLPPI